MKLQNVEKSVYEFARAKCNGRAGDTITATYAEGDYGRASFDFSALGIVRIPYGTPSYGYAVLTIAPDGRVNFVKGDDYVARVARDRIAELAAAPPPPPPPPAQDWSGVDTRGLFDDDEETGWGWKR